MTMTNKKITGRCSPLTGAAMVQRFAAYSKVLGKINKVLEPYIDTMNHYIVVDEFGDYLEQRDWNDATGYYIKIREVPLSRSDTEKFNEVVKKLTDAFGGKTNLVESEQKHPNPWNPNGHWYATIAVIKDVYAIGD